MATATLLDGTKIEVGTRVVVGKLRYPGVVSELGRNPAYYTIRRGNRTFTVTWRSPRHRKGTYQVRGTKDLVEIL